MNNYTKDNVKIYHADCMELLKTYENNYFDLAIVDPPYGIGESGGKNKSRGPGSKDYKDFAGEDKTAPPPEYFDLLNQKCKNLIIWGANHFLDNIPFNMSSPCWLVWDKNRPNQDFADCELAYTSFKTAVKKFFYTWDGFRQQDMKNKEIRIHPTQKPVSLYKWIYENYAEKDFKILDTHLGSGSNAIAAYYFGVDEFIGIELSEHYYKESVKRFKTVTAQTKIKF